MKTDWIGAALGIAGAILVMIDIRAATVVWIISNVALLMWSAKAGVRSIASMQLVFLVINTATLIVRWGRG